MEESEGPITGGPSSEIVLETNPRGIPKAHFVVLYGYISISSKGLSGHILD